MSYMQMIWEVHFMSEHCPHPSGASVLHSWANEMEAASEEHNHKEVNRLYDMAKKKFEQEKEWHIESLTSPLTPFRQKLLELADGTKTNEQLAKETGYPKTTVSSTLSQLRKKGFNIPPCKSTHDRAVNTIERQKSVIAMREKEGMTFVKIANVLGVSAGRANEIYHNAKRLEKTWLETSQANTG